MNIMTLVTVPPPRWRLPLLLWLGVFATLLFAYRETLIAMVTIWDRSATFTHAFVVPPISLWLVWRLRDTLALTRPQPVPWLLLPMALVALAWMLGQVTYANAVSQLAFACLLVLSVPAVLGWAVSRVIAFPLLFLFFAVPVGEALTPILMQWTADFVVAALRVTGVPVYREGQQFVIPSGSWSVVEACSGIRYLMASFMVGSLFAYLNYRSTRRRLAFVAVSIVMPIIANWVRAYQIVMIGHLSNNRLATGVDHIVYGWVFFGVVIIGMFFIGARWSEAPAPAPARSSLLQGAGQSPARPIWPIAALTAALLLAAPALLPRLTGVDDSAVAAPVKLQLPDQLVAGWQAAEQPLADFTPHFSAASAATSRTYESNGRSVGVYVAYYRQQNETRKLVDSTNQLVLSNNYNWNPVLSGRRSVAFAGQSVEVTTTDLLGAAQAGRTDRIKLQAWQWYWVNGTLTRSDIKAKLVSAWQQLSGQGDESAALVLYAPDTQPGQAQAVLDSFVKDNWSRLDSLLRETRHR